MDLVKCHILGVLQYFRTIRIVFDVPTSIFPADNICSAACELAQPIIQFLIDNSHQAVLLAVDRYPRHTYIVMDANNSRYDYDRAHLQTFPIRVYILRLAKSSNQWSLFRRETDDQKLAIALAELHRCNGTAPTPFFTDHVNGSV